MATESPESDERALSALLLESGLNNPKWIKHFHDMEITHPDQITKCENKEKIYDGALLIANKDEIKLLNKLLGIEPKSMFEKVYRALQDAGLDAGYWSKVIAIQTGVVTEQALSYIDDEFYTHLVQFARDPDERSALSKLLNIDDYEYEFKSMCKRKMKNIQERNRNIELIITHLKDLQEQEKPFETVVVQEVKKRALECLLIPEEFCFDANLYKEVIDKMSEFCKSMECAIEKQHILDYHGIISNASGGAALKGVYIMKNGIKKQSNEKLIQTPIDISMQYPYISQHVKYITRLDSEVGWELSIENELFSQYVRRKQDCLTLKCFVVPVSSCYFSKNELRLTDKAEKLLKHIEVLIKSDQASYMMEKVLQFFNEFGSHVRVGPFHFGGYIYWCCSTNSVTNESDEVVAKNLHQEALNFEVKGVIIDKKNVSNISGVLTVNYPDSILQQTTIECCKHGGLQTSSVAAWRNSLLFESESWVLLDDGKEYVPVWEVISNSNCSIMFESATLLASTIKNVYHQSSASPPGNTLPDKDVDMSKFLESIQAWNNADDRMAQCDQLLSYISSKREEVIMQEMDLTYWPANYLTKDSVTNCFILLVESIEHHPEKNRITRTICNCVRPHELTFVPDSSLKMWLQSQSSYMLLMAQDIKLLGTLCHHIATAILKGKTAADFSAVSHPKQSFQAARMFARAVSHIMDYFDSAGEFYDKIYILTLLMPFNYNEGSKVFVTSFTHTEMYGLSQDFKENTDYFYEFKEKRDLKKIQSALILLAINLYKKWKCRISLFQAHCKYMLDTVPGDQIDKNVHKILVTLIKSPGVMDSTKIQLQYIMKDVPPEHDNNMLIRALSIKPEKISKEEVVHKITFSDGQDELFDRLNLRSYYPKKLSLIEAIKIRDESTSSITDQAQTNCSDPNLYSFIVLQKIMSFDSRCRMILIDTTIPENQNSPQVSNDEDDDTSSEEEETALSCIHPMDGLLALLHCADNLLRQDLFGRLAANQIAIPLILPISSSNDLLFTLWALRTIVKQWKSSSGKISHELPIISYPAPIVSFLRLGTHPLSKSRLINIVMSETGLDTFFHYDLGGGSTQQVLVPGLVEVAWYLPSATNSVFKDAITFVNLHGDARNFKKQVDFLSKTSLICFIFLNEEALDEAGCGVLKSLSQVPGGMVLVRTRPISKEMWTAKFRPIKQELSSKSYSYIKIDRNKNEASIKESMQRKIISAIGQFELNQKHPMLSLELCKDIAIECGIIVDEDNEDIMKGRALAESLKCSIDIHINKNPSSSPKDLLPLQGPKLWHEWAIKDKEIYRHNKKGGIRSIEEHAMALRDDMKQIREMQLNCGRCLTPIMQKFVMGLLSCTFEDRKYYLQWLKIILDNLSRETLPPLHEKYGKLRDKLIKLQQMKPKDMPAIEKCKLDMERLNKELIFASFGLEHLFREVGQLYEAMSYKDGDFKSILPHLPKLAAELLIDGYPLELMDGDAAHVPLTWVSAVLKEVNEILENPPILTISILGLQSTGKSTLLNTLFGVRFSVSAGRCTRGAFMQLVPIHESLQVKCKCKYFLLVDTEGLRAPELDAMKTQKHDNELATFVIGLANLTLINIYGETPGDLDDILQTSVHAFLRMKAVKLKPGCHFVHQNVSSVMAGEKGMMGRYNFKAKLDKMTGAAAKEENLESEFTTFSDVIRFNDERDVSHFPSLWKGDPPMAPVNPGYSMKAMALKCKLIDFAEEMNKSNYIVTLSAFTDKLKKFWKAVLYENFVFSFKNTLESSLYTFLDGEISKWSWSYQQCMLEKEHVLERTVLTNLDDPNARSVFEQARDDLLKIGDEKYMSLKKEVEKFFSESPDREILIKWKTETETQLSHTREQLMRHAKTHCEQVWKARLGKVKMLEIGNNHRSIIVSRVKALVSELKEKLNDQELEQKFESEWQIWIQELKKMSVQTQLKEKDIKSEVQSTLRKQFKTYDSMLIQSQDPAHGGKPLEEWGEKLELSLTREHVTLQTGLVEWGKRKFGWAEEVNWKQMVGMIRDEIFNEIHVYLEGIKDKDFHPSFTSQILRVLKEKCDKLKKQKQFILTAQFKVDMALTICGYALVNFQSMVQRFRDQNDPVKCFEQEKKNKYLQMFKDKYNKTTFELATAKLICNDIKGQVEKEVFKRLSIEVEKILRTRSESGIMYIGEKRVVIRKMLEEIGKEVRYHNFDSLSLYISHPPSSIKYWVKKFTEKYCDHGDNLTAIATIACSILNGLMEEIITSTHKVSFSLGDGAFSIAKWVDVFSLELQSKLTLDKSEMREQGGVQMLGDVKYFTEELVKYLEVAKNSLHKQYQKLTSKDLDRCPLKPYDALYDGTDGVNAVSGCEEFCPFCHEPCCGLKNHGGDHEVHKNQHRPQCLGGWSYEGTNKMVISTCTEDVYFNRTFIVEGKTYRCSEASKVFSRWNIKATDRPGESLNFWKYVVLQYKGRLEQIYENSIDTTSWGKLEYSDAINDFGYDYD